MALNLSSHQVLVPPNIYVNIAGKTVSLRDIIGKSYIKELRYNKDLSPAAEILTRFKPGENQAGANIQAFNSLLKSIGRSEQMAAGSTQSVGPMASMEVLKRTLQEATGKGARNFSIRGYYQYQHIVNPYIPVGSIGILENHSVNASLRRYISNTAEALENVMDADGDRANLLRLTVKLRNATHDIISVHKSPLFQTYIKKGLTAKDVVRYETELYGNFTGFDITKASSVTVKDIMAGAGSRYSAKDILSNPNNPLMQVLNGRQEAQLTKAFGDSNLAGDPNLIGILKNKLTALDAVNAQEFRAALISGRLNPQQAAIARRLELSAGPQKLDTLDNFRIMLAYREAPGGTGSIEGLKMVETLIKNTGRGAVAQQFNNILGHKIKIDLVDSFSVSPKKWATSSLTDTSIAIAMLSGGDHNSINEELTERILGASENRVTTGFEYLGRGNRTKGPSLNQATKENLNFLLKPQFKNDRGENYALLEMVPIAPDQKMMKMLGLEGIPGYGQAALIVRGPNGNIIPLGGTHFHNGKDVETLHLVTMLNADGRAIKPGSNEYIDAMARAMGGFELKVGQRHFGMMGAGLTREQLRNDGVLQNDIANLLGIKPGEVARMAGAYDDEQLNNLVLRYDTIKNRKYLDRGLAELQERLGGFGYQAPVSIYAGHGHQTSAAQSHNLKRVITDLGYFNPSEGDAIAQIRTINAGLTSEARMGYTGRLNGTMLSGILSNGAAESVGAEFKAARQGASNVGLDNTTIVLTDLRNLAGREFFDPIKEKTSDAGQELAIADVFASQDIESIMGAKHARDPARSSTYVEGWEKQTTLNQSTGRFEENWYNPNYSSHSKLSIGKLDKLEVRHELDLNISGHPNERHFRTMINGAERTNVLLLGAPGLKQTSQIIDMAAYEAGLHGSPEYKNFVELQEQYTLAEASGSTETLAQVATKLKGAMVILQQKIAKSKINGVTLENLISKKKSIAISVNPETQKHFGFIVGVQRTSAEVAAGRRMDGLDQISGQQNIAYLNQSLTEMFSSIDETKFGSESQRRRILTALSDVVAENVANVNVPAFVAQKAGMTARIEQIAFQQGMAEAVAEGMETLGSAAGAEVWAVSKSFLAKAATKLF